MEKRIFGYDLIKAVAIFLIVLYHLGSVDFGSVPPEGWYVPNLTKILYAFCAAGVPLFFMVSGALQASKPLVLRRCVEKSVRLIAVAVFWTLIFKCVLYPLIMHAEYPNFGEFKNYYWFLYTLAELYWINYIVGRSKWLRICVTAVLILFPFLTNLIWVFILGMNQSAQLPSWGHTGVFTMYSVAYFYLGGYLSKREVRSLWALLLIFIGLLLVNGEVVVMSTYYREVYDGVNACFPTVGAMAMSAGLFSLMKPIRMEQAPTLRSWFSLVGSNTIGVYILHLFALMMIREFIFNNQPVHVLLALLTVVMVVAVTSMISSAIRKSPLKVLMKL